MAKRNAQQILGDAVRCGREAAGLSQEALGERADLHRNEIGALERGEQNISFVNLLRVCAAPASRPATCSPISPSFRCANSRPGVRGPGIARSRR
jgi:transcriptional regulator with XRE-family HTH domain